MMFPQPISRAEFRSEDSDPDPIRIFEQHLLAGFPPGHALDLVLSGLVIRAAEAIHATAAVLAFLRNGEMVCRATTGRLAPELGVSLNTREGLLAACLETRRAQLSVDTEFDPRVDPAVPSRLGIRSILIVPVFEMETHTRATVIGVLEVFSTAPAAFSNSDRKLLEGFADECARIQPALERSQSLSAPLLASGPVVAEIAWRGFRPEPVDPELLPHEFGAPLPPPVARHNYAGWTLVLDSLAILAFISIGLLIGSRVGWLHFASPHAEIVQPVPAETIPDEPGPSAVRTPAQPPPAKRLAKTAAQSLPSPLAAAAGELVVYEKGKVIFRMKSDAAATGPEKSAKLAANRDAAGQANDSIVQAASKNVVREAAPASSPMVWMSPAEAEARLITRAEPRYPSEARAAGRTGDVVLEVQVAEDGSVSNVNILSGDAALAPAAVAAVRNWRYQPYRPDDRPAHFLTDVTLSFNLPH